MAQIDIYQYGEILGYPADGATAAENTAWIDEYAEYIGVSDTVYSTALMSAVRDGTTYKSTGNWIKRGVDAGKIVNWAESHDSYANEPSHGGWTKTLDQSVIDKAYALLAARADSQTLYLSRPSQTAHQSIYYGQKGSTHFTSKEVAEVNRFHNAMIGKDEKVLGASTYYAVLRSGGAVIVTKSSDIDVTVNNNGFSTPSDSLRLHIANVMMINNVRDSINRAAAKLSVLRQPPVDHLILLRWDARALSIQLMTAKPAV